MERAMGTIRKILLITAIVAGVYLSIREPHMVSMIASRCATILSPFAIGLGLAFILNVPLRFLEEKVWKKLAKGFPSFLSNRKRGLCLLTVYLSMSLLLLAMALLIAPRFKESCSLFAKNLPGYLQELNRWLEQLLKRFSLSPSLLSQLVMDWEAVGSSAPRAVPDVLGGTMEVAAHVVRGAVHFAVGIALSVYMLAQKERHCRNGKRLLFALLSRKQAERLIAVGSLSNEMFSRFVTGQLTEAAIIGVLCFLGMQVFSIPYAPLIAMVVSVTALIPVFGAFIGTAFGAFLLLMVRPITALWFVLFIIVLQQIEGSFIYPRVVGNSIGLPGIWVLSAVTLGGNLFGVTGMLLGVPVSAVLYGCLRQWIDRRLREKEISETEIRQAGKKEDP